MRSLSRLRIGVCFLGTPPIGPWPWRGAQGLWEIDEDELGRVANRELGIDESEVNGNDELPR